MPLANEAEVATRPQKQKKTATACYHCGQPCLTNRIAIADKQFCCDGCKLVYEILNEKDLCDYYKLQQHPGLSQIKSVRKDKYAYLDDDSIANKLFRFTDGDLVIITLYIPSIHCSSCMWLLEHLDRINPGVRESRVNFSAKEITIHFYKKKVSLRSIVELLTTIGYEPYISLEDINEKAAKSLNKQRIIKLGIAGFCFGNIMMMSFPEYLSEKTGIEEQYTYLFRYLNLGLSLPVFFYAASEFFHTAWTGLKQKILNIDAPIVLALIITFTRSIYEILSGTGAGYLDSMSGIVFFMLAGRIVQERTYKSLSFSRDYKSYFPIAVNVKTKSGIVSTQLSDLKKDDIVVLHHDEIIPADSVVLNENAFIDYSFVTGEAEPVRVNVNEKVYAGGRQTGEELIIKVEKPIAGSYLTSLWNHFAFRKNKEANNDQHSVIHLLSKYFTIILFTLAAGTAAYWYLHDPSKIINAVSAMLIVACPCALLLSATFTNSSILRILSLNGLFLRDATVIEQIAATNHIVFDKTGTLTKGNTAVTITGDELTDTAKDLVYSVVRQSNHPNSKALAAWLGDRNAVALDSWKETPGQGLQATSGNTRIIVGSAMLVDVPAAVMDEKANLYIRINSSLTCVHLHADVREGIPGLTTELRERYKLSLLSGDNDKQKAYFEGLLGSNSKLLFSQKPLDKLSYIEHLQERGEKVMMIGDGLNDAGALQQSNVGITLADDVNNFTPACDAIFNAEKLSSFARLIEMARTGGHIITVSFIISILYNFVGLWFSMRGMMKPVTAAILMPCSTLSIVIISSGLSNLIAWRKGLSIRS